MRRAEPIWTDFSRYPHEELIRALSASRPTDLIAAGDAWAQTAAALHERAEDVAGQGARLAASWTGKAADDYRAMLSEMVDGTRRLGAAATAARDLVYAAAEALATAWTSMPPVSGEAARRQAVLIMAALAERYLEAAAALNRTMSELVPGQGGALPMGLVFGEPGGGNSGHEPLFGRMVPAGLAAAGAVLGRPFLPGLLGGRNPAAEALPAAVPASPASPPAAAAPVPAAPVVAPLAEPAAFSGGGGGGGGGFGGLSGGGGLPALPDLDPAPVSHPSHLAETAGIAAASGVGVAAARSGFAAPPMMPMGMMGAGGEGGSGRRLPPWLVETENVWGESSTVTSPVIGEDVAGGSWW